MWVTAWFYHLYILGQNKTIYILNYKNKKYNIMLSLSLHKFGIILCQKPGKQPFPCMLYVMSNRHRNLLQTEEFSFEDVL